jgi:adenosylhomocysteinase
MRAKVEGFFPLPLYELLPRCGLIVGCTGQTSIRLPDMEYIKDGAILVSASSKDIEFAIKDFEQNCVSVELVNDVTQKYTQKSGKQFYVLHNGMPINFRDKSILGTMLDMIYCELFVCMREVAEGNVSNGLYHSPPPIQDEVAKVWLMNHSPSFSDHEEDKVWDYPESMKLGLPKK